MPQVDSKKTVKVFDAAFPISVHGIFTCTWLIFMVNVGKNYTTDVILWVLGQFFVTRNMFPTSLTVCN